MSVAKTLVVLGNRKQWLESTNELNFRSAVTTGKTTRVFAKSLHSSNPKSEFPVLEIVNFILKNISFKMLKFEAILTLTDSHPLHHMIQPY